jgi:hypothetical protein
MFRRPFTHVAERAAKILEPETPNARIASIGERMEWMRGGAVLANMRMLRMNAGLTAAGMPFGYWRGLHPRMRMDFELALLSRGQQCVAAEPRFNVMLMGMRHARTLQRATRRLIAMATAADEKLVEIMHVEVGRRCGMTFVELTAQPLRLRPALRDDYVDVQERSA